MNGAKELVCCTPRVSSRDFKSWGFLPHCLGTSGFVLPGYLRLCCFATIGGKRREEPRSPVGFVDSQRSERSRAARQGDSNITMRAWPVARSIFDAPYVREANEGTTSWINSNKGLTTSEKKTTRAVCCTCKPRAQRQTSSYRLSR